MRSAPSPAPSSVSENRFEVMVSRFVEEMDLRKMTDEYLNLIDAEDLELTAAQISAKALVLMRSIGTGETEEERQAIAAKARAYFKRLGAIREPEPEPFPFQPISEIRWNARHEGMSWGEIREEWTALRRKIASTKLTEWSEEQVRPLQELCWMENFIESCWPEQSEIVDQIREERRKNQSNIPPS